MKSQNEIREKIKKLEHQLFLLDVQIKKEGLYLPAGIEMEKQYKEIENEVRALKWALS